MRCACANLKRLDGFQADEYARDHLLKVAVHSVNWTKTRRCEETGTTWLMDYPSGGEHGGGLSRLRQFDEDGALTEHEASIHFGNGTCGPDLGLIGIRTALHRSNDVGIGELTSEPDWADSVRRRTRSMIPVRGPGDYLSCKPSNSRHLGLQVADWSMY